MGIPEKIAQFEAEMAKTQKNKATEHALGLLKAKIAKLKRDQEVGVAKKSGKSSAGFDVKKSGNATAVLIGLPSVGKSSILNALTGSKSRIAYFAFTTLTCIPGTLKYKGADIQILDLPGIIAGAKEGKGRGKEVLAVARNADLVLLILDIHDVNYRDKLIAELEGINIRLDKEPPRIAVFPQPKGGVHVGYTITPTHLNDKIIRDVLKEYDIQSANVTIASDATVDELIDHLAGNRRYAKSLTIINKIDLASPGLLKSVKYPFVGVSCTTGEGVEELKEAIYQKLNLIRVYTKPRFEQADLTEPLMLRKGSTIGDACDQIHRELRETFKYAQIWGPSAKHPGQKLSLSHKLKDGDVIYIVAK